MSIDGFGTGYSSLSYLQQFKVEELKKDQSFARSIGTSTDGMKIVLTIVQFGKTLQQQTFICGPSGRRDLLVSRTARVSAKGMNLRIVCQCAVASVKIVVAISTFNPFIERLGSSEHRRTFSVS